MALNSWVCCLRNFKFLRTLLGQSVRPLATLTQNASGKFEDRWIYLQATPGKCPFLTGYERFHLPVAHAEGQFICRQAWILRHAFDSILAAGGSDPDEPGGG